VGGGPAGLTAALVARRLGLDVTVFDQALRFDRVGGGILLHSNGLRVLDALELLDTLRPGLRFTQSMTLEAAGGRILSAFDYRDFSIPQNHGAVLLRSTLQLELYDACRVEGIPIRFEHMLTALAQDDAGVSLHFANGATERFAIVIGCDGMHSVVRQASELGGSARPLPTSWLRGTTPVRTESNTIREIWGDDGRGFGILPLPGDSTHFFCEAPPEEEWQHLLAHPAALGIWVSGWEPWGEDVLRLVRSVPDWSALHYGRPGLVTLRRWHRERVFLIGDAAHAMPPDLGQGANAAMVDAVVLLSLLARVLRGDSDLETAGTTYETVRRSHITKTQVAARGLSLAAHLRLRLPRDLGRDLIAWNARMRTPLFREATTIFIGLNPAEEGFLLVPCGREQSLPGRTDSVSR
jgi:2-polyprenyl-6-methoxyphenol hydroxylase-like FAD-dependent oxidoreductase